MSKRILFTGYSPVHFLCFGGTDYSPIARNYTILLFKELDQDRKDEIVVQHVEQAREIWVVYPALVNTQSIRKVFIYNYEDKSCVIDDYASAELRLTAVSPAKPSTFITWNDLVGDWNNQQLSWSDYEESGLNDRIIMGAFQAINIEGKVPNDCNILERANDLYFLETDNSSRFGKGIPAIFETADEDWGNKRVFKYTDEQHFTFDFEEPIPVEKPLFLFVSLLSRDTSDGTFRVSSEYKLEVTGDGSDITRTNIRVSGRYIRVRVRSDQSDIMWQISEITLYARMGGNE